MESRVEDEEETTQELFPRRSGAARGSSDVRLPFRPASWRVEVQMQALRNDGGVVREESSVAGAGVLMGGAEADLA